MLRFLLPFLFLFSSISFAAGVPSVLEITDEYHRRNESGELAVQREPLSFSHDCQRQTWSLRAEEVIEYDDCTPKAGPAVAVVLWHHGGPGEGITRGYYAWSRAPGLRHIQINQPGLGRSTGGVGWSPEQSVDDEAALLTHLGVSGPVFVGGWSWGSTMSLLFAQRHPERTRALLVGGIWSNSRADVGWYMGPRGARQYLPGLENGRLYESVGRRWSACGLRDALLARPALAAEYVWGEAQQAAPLSGSHWTPSTRPDPRFVPFAQLESDMMCRAEQGKWQLRFRWPAALASVPLIVVQGRYDMVCRPETALALVRSWPSAEKTVIWTSNGHFAASWHLPGDLPTPLTQEQVTAIERQTRRLMQPNGAYLGIALERLIGIW